MAFHSQEQGFARMVAGLFLLNEGHEVHHRRFHQRIPGHIPDLGDVIEHEDGVSADDIGFCLSPRVIGGIGSDCGGDGFQDVAFLHHVVEKGLGFQPQMRPENGDRVNAVGG
jgi:hypothetical protein